MKRDLVATILKDMYRKIVLISGHRQCGKTTLSKMLSDDFAYLNYDNDSDRNDIEKKLWDRKKSYLFLMRSTKK